MCLSSSSSAACLLSLCREMCVGVLRRHIHPDIHMPIQARAKRTRGSSAPSRIRELCFVCFSFLRLRPNSFFFSFWSPSRLLSLPSSFYHNLLCSSKNTLLLFIYNLFFSLHHLLTLLLGYWCRSGCEVASHLFTFSLLYITHTLVFRV